MKKYRLGCLLLLSNLFLNGFAFGQTAAFQYQGSLRIDGELAEGSYDLRFALFAQQTEGPEVASSTHSNVTVSNSLFTAALDFGELIFNGTNYWLEIGVAPGNTGGPYETLQPRQPLASVPYAVHALTAGMVIPTSAQAVPLTNMVLIPAGSFVMGSFPDEQDRESNEGPVTATTISRPFWMGIHEVTQGEYFDRMGNNPSEATGDLQRPVERVTWNDAVAYCAALTAEQRAAGHITGHFEYRLPTEAEWEYACRAGTVTRYYFGDDPSYTNLTRYAWTTSNSGGTPHPVGEKRPNAWGLYDMHGNVWEWCLDHSGGVYPGGAAIDPAGPADGVARVLRGGSWTTLDRVCRSARRFGFPPDLSVNDFGFRVVLAEVRP